MGFWKQKIDFINEYTITFGPTNKQINILTLLLYTVFLSGITLGGFALGIKGAQWWKHFVSR